MADWIRLITSSGPDYWKDSDGNITTTKPANIIPCVEDTVVDTTICEVSVNTTERLCSETSTEVWYLAIMSDKSVCYISATGETTDTMPEGYEVCSLDCGCDDTNGCAYEQVAEFTSNNNLGVSSFVGGIKIESDLAVITAIRDCINNGKVAIIETNLGTSVISDVTENNTGTTMSVSNANTVDPCGIYTHEVYGGAIGYTSIKVYCSI